MKGGYLDKMSEEQTQTEEKAEETTEEKKEDTAEESKE